MPGSAVRRSGGPVEVVITFTNPGISKKVKGLVNDPYNEALGFIR